MATLITVKGPNAGRRFPLGETAVIGRQPDVAIYLESLAVSRQHARIVAEQGHYFIEDVGSSNGTYLNGHRIAGRVPLTERDMVQIGPYELSLMPDPSTAQGEAQVIRARVDAMPSNHTLFARDPGQKLQLVLQIARDLGHTLDLDQVLGKLLDHLLRLFTQADRGMVLLADGDRLVVRAQRSRLASGGSDQQYSRTIVRKALDEGVGILSEDVRSDRNLVMSATLMSLNLRSFLCVPMIGWENKRLGVIQLDCMRSSAGLTKEDLETLTAISLQAAMVVQSARYHAERLREERLRQEIMLARDIQMQFLPDQFGVAGPTAELYARCLPAREVSGDLYDFFPLADGRLAFYVGDVSGKGMPAALFMIAVRTLARHLVPQTAGVSEFLQKLNAALAADNPTHLFVTIVFGIYDGKDGSVTVACGGHPPPLLRHPDGRVEVVPLKPGMMLGAAVLPLKPLEAKVTLAPGDSLVLYTDGYFEATAPDGQTLFGIDRLREVLGGTRATLPLEVCAAEASAEVRRFTQSEEQQDDQTLLLLRRK